MEGVSIVSGAEILVTSGGLGAFYYSLMTILMAGNQTRGHAPNAAPALFTLKRVFNKALAKTLG